MAAQMPTFFKIVLQHNIDTSILMLPSTFTREHNTAFSDSAQLVVPDGLIWTVGLTGNGDQLSLSNGLEEFAGHYSLGDGHVLMFYYKGGSRFDVGIFGPNKCQISYPPLGPRTEEEESFATSQHFRSQRPSFRVAPQKSNFSHGILYLPANFVKSVAKEQLEKGLIWLEASDRRRWRVTLQQRTNGRISIESLSEFFSDNNLKREEACVFELVEEAVFKVSMYCAG